MKRLISALLLLSMLLSGCSLPSAPTDPTTEPTEESTEATEITEATQPSTEPTEEPTEAPTEPPTEPPLLYHDPLTGVPQAEPYTGRPVAISINNVKAAMPRHSVSQADVLYEMLVEGGLTRCLAVYSDLSDVEAIGSVRSARNNFIDIAMSYNALFVHAGGSSYAYKMLKETKWNHIDGIGWGLDGKFYRDADRLNSGYSREHTLFTTGAGIMHLAANRKFNMSLGEVDYGLQFAEDATPDGEPAQQIMVKFGIWNKRTYMTYHEDGSYHLTQYDKPVIDGNTGLEESYENVFIIYAKHNLVDNRYQFAELLGSGSGYFACGGKLIRILWHHENADDPITYTLEDGTPLIQGIGSSYVAILPTGSTVKWE